VKSRQTLVDRTGPWAQVVSIHDPVKKWPGADAPSKNELAPGFPSKSLNRPSKMFQTGFQSTPVDLPEMSPIFIIPSAT
jgi:hypothetical protein